MDQFVNSVTSQCFLLHPVDTQAAFLNIPYHFFYSNTSDTVNFMPANTLKTGFYKALCYFPILAGNLMVDSHGRTCINVERERLNMPEYVESASEVHFNYLKANKYHWSSWPKGLSTAGAITKANNSGVIKLLNVHTVRMKDNSGVAIFVNMPHYVVDGTGLFTFVELWGRMCRHATIDVLGLNLTFDRHIIKHSIEQADPDYKPLDTAMVKVYTGFNPIADLLAWLSPKTRSWIMDKARNFNDVSSATFRISRKQLAELSTSVFNYTERVDDTHVLAALVSMVVAQAHRDNNSSRNLQVMSLSLLTDLRKSLKIHDKNYMGNGLIPFSAECPLDLLEAPIDAMALAKATQFVSKIYKSVDAGLVASFVDMVTNNHKSFTRPAVYLATNPTALVITNETEFKLYAADFGYGTPKWVCTLPCFAANFVGLLPAPAPSSDIIINITMKTSVLRHIVSNNIWKSMVTSVY